MAKDKASTRKPRRRNARARDDGGTRRATEATPPVRASKRLSVQVSAAASAFLVNFRLRMDAIASIFVNYHEERRELVEKTEAADLIEQNVAELMQLCYRGASAGESRLARRVASFHWGNLLLSEVQKARLRMKDQEHIRRAARLHEAVTQEQERNAFLERIQAEEVRREQARIAAARPVPPPPNRATGAGDDSDEGWEESDEDDPVEDLIHRERIRERDLLRTPGCLALGRKAFRLEDMPRVTERDREILRRVLYILREAERRNCGELEVPRPREWALSDFGDTMTTEAIRARFDLRRLQRLFPNLDFRLSWSVRFNVFVQTIDAIALDSNLELTRVDMEVRRSTVGVYEDSLACQLLGQTYYVHPDKTIKITVDLVVTSEVIGAFPRTAPGRAEVQIKELGFHFIDPLAPVAEKEIVPRVRVFIPYLGIEGWISITLNDGHLIVELKYLQAMHVKNRMLKKCCYTLYLLELADRLRGEASRETLKTARKNVVEAKTGANGSEYLVERWRGLAETDPLRLEFDELARRDVAAAAADELPVDRLQRVPDPGLVNLPTIWPRMRYAQPECGVPYPYGSKLGLFKGRVGGGVRGMCYRVIRDAKRRSSCVHPPRAEDDQCPAYYGVDLVQHHGKPVCRFTVHEGTKTEALRSLENAFAEFMPERFYGITDNPKDGCPKGKVLARAQIPGGRNTRITFGLYDSKVEAAAHFNIGTTVIGQIVGERLRWLNDPMDPGATAASRFAKTRSHDARPLAEIAAVSIQEKHRISEVVVARIEEHNVERAEAEKPLPPLHVAGASRRLERYKADFALQLKDLAYVEAADEAYLRDQAAALAPPEPMPDGSRPPIDAHSRRVARAGLANTFERMIERRRDRAAREREEAQARRRTAASTAAVANFYRDPCGLLEPRALAPPGQPRRVAKLYVVPNCEIVSPPPPPIYHVTENGERLLVLYATRVQRPLIPAIQAVHKQRADFLSLFDESEAAAAAAAAAAAERGDEAAPAADGAAEPAAAPEAPAEALAEAPPTAPPVEAPAEAPPPAAAPAKKKKKKRSRRRGPAPPAEISEYERTRMRNIAAGNKKLYSLGLIHPPPEVVADPEHSWWSERARTRAQS
ncbi:hypothetical protein AURANDRAFT_68474 [Aureococcus anophagefferens]|uniref:Uncharacterized protein n=1 Tax=Aureococcus anophagefferens TaxID=44056 RepID=F0YPS4_AURAN|nr:hypothetical protein AURANDRAFT_68474 [Aureococcus anophagefferens]EGB02884.1 hypothetical protein AURANDRAFT_68474 [Aureococcus anophagefferens]|eukprot:XP_009042416.1 hypothetical protein AURANDRAFT_68474 [Aureococcus anophagefferens]